MRSVMMSVAMPPSTLMGSVGVTSSAYSPRSSYMPTMCARENPSSPSTRSSMGTYRTGGATSGWVFRDMVSMRRRYQGG